MMDFITNGPLGNALAPRVEVGQQALNDALRSKDVKRTNRIIERVARQSRRGIESSREKEADLNALGQRGLRPIHIAAAAGMSESVQALLVAGVPVDTLGNGGNTPLHLAVYNEADASVAVLIAAGASVTQENSRGETAIHLARTEKILTILCPLHYAASHGMLDNLVSLIKEGASVEVPGKDGNTPLHAAVAGGKADSVLLLLRRGADPTKENVYGLRPSDLARRLTGSVGTDIIVLLESAQTKGANTSDTCSEPARHMPTVKRPFEEGEEVLYMRDGTRHPALVMKVHHDDDEPYYTIKMLDTGRERQTDTNHIIRRNCVRGCNGGTLNEDMVVEDVGEQVDDTADQAGLVDESRRESRVASINSVLGSGEGQGSEQQGKWEAASSLLWDCRTKLWRPSSKDGGADKSRETSPTAILSAALAAMPAAEANDIMFRYSSSHPGCGIDEQIVSGPAKGSFITSAGPTDVATAEAMADVCRNLVLTCMLAGRER